MVAVVGTNSALAAVKANGSAVAWGDPECGADASAVAGFLASGIASITANPCAFVALNKSGAVAAWGSSAHGGSMPPGVAASLTSGVQAVYGTQTHGAAGSGAFMALRGGGLSAICWGDAAVGGDCSSLAKQLVNVAAVYSNSVGFAAVTTAGALVGPWGDDFDNPVTPIDVGSGVTSVTVTDTAWAVLKNNTGQVIAFGDLNAGGYVPRNVAAKLLKGARSLYANQAAFVAVNRTGGSLTAVSQGMAANLLHCASACKQPVKPLPCCPPPPAPPVPCPQWGDPASGGDDSQVAGVTGVVSVASTLSAFAALLNNGSIFAWGSPEFGGDASAVATQLAAGGFVSVQATAYAFAALRANGSTVCWGSSLGGGDCSSVPLTGVQALYSSGAAFAALVTALPKTVRAVRGQPSGCGARQAAALGLTVRPPAHRSPRHRHRPRSRHPW